MTGDDERDARGPGMPQATGGRRISWEALPGEVTAPVERLLGGEVVSAVGQPGGFSAGLSARVCLANGARRFVKAANSLNAPAEAAFHRREAAISGRLPGEVSAPRLLDVYDDGVWVALVFEDIAGRLPAQPWRRDELDRVLTAVTEQAQILTPSPVDEGILAKPRLGGWRALAGDAVVENPERPSPGAAGHPPRLGSLTAPADDAALGNLERLSPWAAGHLDELAAMEENASVAGTTLLHGDLYPFNIMLTSDRVFTVDWPHAWIGARHCDVVTLLSSASLSGIDPQPIADGHPLTRDLDAVQINDVLVLHAGFLLRTAATAGADADPTIVNMMVALGRASLRWLRERL